MFRLLLSDIAQSSPKASGELAGVNDELHLVLMEITELSTRMYSFRQAEVVLPPTAPATT